MLNEDAVYSLVTDERGALIVMLACSAARAEKPAGNLTPVSSKCEAKGRAYRLCLSRLHWMRLRPECIASTVSIGLCLVSHFEISCITLHSVFF
jgi:hypothetical protein